MTRTVCAVVRGSDILLPYQEKRVEILRYSTTCTRFRCPIMGSDLQLSKGTPGAWQTLLRRFLTEGATAKSTWFTTRPFLTLLIGLTTGLLIGIATMIGTPVTTSRPRPAAPQMPEPLLHATASHSGDTLVMATCWMDAEIEGLFTLDCLTGDLQCFVINPKLGGIGAAFHHNIIGDLGAVSVGRIA